MLIWSYRFYVLISLQSLVITSEECASDKDSCDAHCVQQYRIHTETEQPVTEDIARLDSAYQQVTHDHK